MLSSISRVRSAKIDKNTSILHLSLILHMTCFALSCISLTVRMAKRLAEDTKLRLLQVGRQNRCVLSFIMHISCSNSHVDSTPCYRFTISSNCTLLNWENLFLSRKDDQHQHCKVETDLLFFQCHKYIALHAAGFTSSTEQLGDPDKRTKRWRKDCQIVDLTSRNSQWWPMFSSILRNIIVISMLEIWIFFTWWDATHRGRR